MYSAARFRGFVLNGIKAHDRPRRLEVEKCVRGQDQIALRCHHHEVVGFTGGVGTVVATHLDVGFHAALCVQRRNGFSLPRGQVFPRPRICLQLRKQVSFRVVNEGRLLLEGGAHL